MCDGAIFGNCINGWCAVSGECYGAFRKGWKCCIANGGRSEINQLLFTDGAALVADAGEVV